MNNIQIVRTSKQIGEQQSQKQYKKLNLGQPLRSSYEPATKTILFLSTDYRLHFLTYSPQQMTLQLRNSTSPIQELKEQNIVLLDYIVDAESAVVFTENGAIMTINEKGEVDLKAQNDDGISGGSISPTQEYIYAVTKNSTLIQLNMEFDLQKQVPLDDNQTEKVDSYDPRFSWKVDGSFFAINIMTDKGRKCHTRDNMLDIFRSPSKSDPEPEGLVQSVSQKSRQNMTPLVAWQPSAGIISGADFINKAGKKVNRIIFWEKNGLRHLQFQLPNLVTDVLNLTWSPDSQILCAQVLLINSQRWLYLYYRSNYRWCLKFTIRLQTEQTQYFLLKTKLNQVITFDKQQFRSFQYVLQPTQKQFCSEKQELKDGAILQTCIDGQILQITDFSLGVIPPPMSHFNAQFQTNLHAVSVHSRNICVITQNSLWLCKWNGHDLNERIKIESPQIEQLCLAPHHMRINNKETQFILQINDKVYEISSDSSLIPYESEQNDYEDANERKFAYFDGKQNQEIISSLSQAGTLFIDGKTFCQHCTSYIFYHDFLIFTVGSSDMYDKMFIIDLALDSQNEVKDDIKVRLQQWQTNKLLNYRSVERGAKIIGCSKNRVIFQLPRGNLQTISPKVMTIKQVYKFLSSKQFKQAFETIRTHKLDLNLLYDIDPETFTEHAEEILVGIGRTDYLNLFVSQLKDNISDQLQYCITKAKIEEVQDYVSVRLQNKKIKEVCQIVSKTLRKANKERFILSIFTSQIKMGLLDDVLFQIKGMRKNDVQQIIPPHLQQQNKKKKKSLNSQQILEYVCWLVDANVIYEASLLTYDLQLASMTARCTQMDPKQYIPYLEELKAIANPVQLKRKICMDLKRYQKAVQELSKGNEQQIRMSIDLIKKHKLFKCGLKSYRQNPEQLKEIKTIVIDQLISTGQNNQAYKISLSIGAFDKALQIAIKSTDGRKIEQIIQCHQDKTKQQKQAIIRKIINSIGEEGFKNKGDLARLRAYIGQFDEATKLYIRAGDYQQAYRYYVKSTQKFKQSGEFLNGMNLLYSIQKNQLIKDKTNFLQKSVRLHKVHKLKSVQGPTLNVRNLDNDDMYSEVSVSSKAASQYTVSTTTGLRKKKDKKRSILSRNVKQGSSLEQQYLVAFLADLLSKVDQTIKQTKLLIQHLIYVNMIEQAESLRNVCKDYAEVASKISPKFYAQVKFETDHPQYLELLEVYENKGIIEKDKGKERRDRFSVDSFSYLF